MCNVAGRLLLLIVLALACSKPADTGRAGSAGAPTPPSPSVAPSEAAAPVLRHGLLWYDDAPEAALAAARAAGKPVLVELWAPWCHTCLSMQSFVLTSVKLGAVAERFVWLAINTERAENAAFLERLPVGVWPTLYVLSAERADVLGRWLGAASPAQLVRFLSESERAGELLREPARSANDPLALLAKGDEQATRARFADAAATYAQALKRAPEDWARRPEALVARMTALRKAEQTELCLELADTALRQTGASASAVDFSSHALDCAERASAGGARSERVRRAVEKWLTPLCREGSPELTPDDQADACSKLADARTALLDKAGARDATLRRLEVLERATQGAPEAVAVTYDWAFTDTLLALDRAEEALERSRQRERALPRDYNPPQHQARAYKALGRFDEGLAAIERALALAYGPRKVGFLTLKADLLIGAGRSAQARQVVEEQLAQYRALPTGQKQPAAEARVERRLRDWP